MKHPDSFKTVSSRLLVAVVLGGAAIGLTAAPTAQAGAPCKLTKHFITEVDEACKLGGIAEAKKVMQGAKKNWMADHEDWKSCDKCHNKSFEFAGGPAEQEKWADKIRKYIPKK